MKSFFDLGERTFTDRPSQQVVAYTLRVWKTLEQLVWNVRHGAR